MRIIIRDNRYSIDRLTLTRCMEAMGFNWDDIGKLSLTVRTLGPKAVQIEESHNNYLIDGRFTPPASIAIYTHDFPKTRVNKIIIHELSHYLDSVKRANMRIAIETFSPEQFFHLLGTLPDVPPLDGENIKYQDKPSEIRARQKADEFASKYNITHDE